MVTSGSLVTNVHRVAIWHVDRVQIPKDTLKVVETCSESLCEQTDVKLDGNLCIILN